MKITSEQLKKIISEEIKKFTLNESDSDHLMALGTGGAAFATALDEVEEDFKAYYNPNDPSMEGLVKESWDDQVSMAREEFEDELIELHHKIESKLLDGGYAPGNWEGPTELQLARKK